jgi:hypothetical protein
MIVSGEKEGIKEPSERIEGSAVRVFGGVNGNCSVYVFAA